MKNCTKVCQPSIIQKAAKAKLGKTKLNIQKQGFIPQSQRIMRPDEFVGLKSKQDVQTNKFPTNIIMGFLKSNNK